MLRPLGLSALALLALSACAELGIETPDLFATQPQEAKVSDSVSDPVMVEEEVFPHIDPPLPRKKPPEAGTHIARTIVPEGTAEDQPESASEESGETTTDEDDTAGVSGDNAAPVADPETLIGLDFERARNLLGDPALLIEEPPAKIWAYNGRSCVLHLHFYPKVGGSDFRILTYNMVGADTDAGEEAEGFQSLCLSQLLAEAESAKPATAASNSNAAIGDATTQPPQEEAQGAE